MPAIKSLDKISKKWARVSALSGPSYLEGIQSTTKDWAEATEAAGANYATGVVAAIADKRFEAGVRAAGTDKWRRNAIAKGPDRFAQGVRLAENAYRDGFEPYRRVIEATTLPPRGPKGDPQNIERVRVMAEALHQEKLRIAGG